jgi:hypothetical protein
MENHNQKQNSVSQKEEMASRKWKKNGKEREPARKIRLSRNFGNAKIKKESGRINLKVNGTRQGWS